MEHKKFQFDHLLFTKTRSTEVNKILDVKAEVEDYIFSNSEEFKDIVHVFNLSYEGDMLAYQVESYKKPMLN